MFLQQASYTPSFGGLGLSGNIRAVIARHVHYITREILGKFINDLSPGPSAIPHTVDEENRLSPAYPMYVDFAVFPVDVMICAHQGSRHCVDPFLSYHTPFERPDYSK